MKLYYHTTCSKIGDSIERLNINYNRSHRNTYESLTTLCFNNVTQVFRKDVKL